MDIAAKTTIDLKKKFREFCVFFYSAQQALFSTKSHKNKSIKSFEIRAVGNILPDGLGNFTDIGVPVFSSLKFLLQAFRFAVLIDRKGAPDAD